MLSHYYAHNPTPLEFLEMPVRFPDSAIHLMCEKSFLSHDGEFLYMDQKKPRSSPIIQLPKLSRDEIEQVLSSEHLCTIAFQGDRYPFMIPMQYVYLDKILYFHFTQYGEKLDFIHQNPKVCVQINKLGENLDHYSFVTIQGTLIPESKLEVKEKVLQLLISQSHEKISVNFVAVHGIGRENGWEGLQMIENSFIMKLTDILYCSGLKSPYEMD